MLKHGNDADPSIYIGCAADNTLHVMHRDKYIRPDRHARLAILRVSNNVICEGSRGIVGRIPLNKFTDHQRNAWSGI